MSVLFLSLCLVICNVFLVCYCCFSIALSFDLIARTTVNLPILSINAIRPEIIGVSKEYSVAPPPDYNLFTSQLKKRLNKMRITAPVPLHDFVKLLIAIM